MDPSSVPPIALNAVDWLSQDIDLIAIRAKSQTRRPLSSIEDSTALTAQLVNVVGIPLAFIALGLLRWRWYQRRRRLRAQEVAGAKRE